MIVAAKKIKASQRMTARLAALAVSGALITGCSTMDVLDTSETFKQGYVIDEQTLSLVPEGSSRAQVLLALGTPTTTNSFGDEEVFYYISQTRKRRAQFLKPRLVNQRVVAVYFDEESKVRQLADYGLQDGRVFDFITRTTPTGGRDQTFLTQILTGTLGGPTPESVLGQ
ncbi:MULTISPECIES: outer membrane protein assembly factor BamE [unclassified Roseitalea]|uniref:outer membrane protein assembly factor BamE n=1 Tax=unclassified Roseitalea TaxID=2639107 RepID=UPI00273F1DCB|nr:MULTISPECIES: outer membrane protein assembly factor BamE [unclassified Roseitalea]